MLHDARKRLWVIRCKLGEHFSVQRNILLFEFVHEHAVAHAERAYRRVDAHREELAKVALLLFAVLKRVVSRMGEHLVRLALLLVDVAAHALGLRKDILSVLQFCGVSFYSHGGSKLAAQKTTLFLVREYDRLTALARELLPPWLGRVKVVAARLTHKKLSSRCDPYTFRE